MAMATLATGLPPQAGDMHYDSSDAGPDSNPHFVSGGSAKKKGRSHATDLRRRLGVATASVRHRVEGLVTAIGERTSEEHSVEVLGADGAALVEGLSVLTDSLEQWMTQQEMISQMLLQGQEKTTTLLQELVSRRPEDSARKLTPYASWASVGVPLQEMEEKGCVAEGRHCVQAVRKLHGRTEGEAPAQPAAGALEEEEEDELSTSEVAHPVGRQHGLYQRKNTLFRDVREHWSKLQPKSNSQTSRVPVSQRRRMDADANRSCLLRFVKGRPFEVAVLCVVLANASFIGFQVQWGATHLGEEADEPSYFAAVEGLFSILFVGELALRLVAECWQFCTGPDWAWNSFDVVMVALILLEQLDRYVLERMAHLSGMSTLRVLRAVRVLRALRAIRILQALKGLRVLLQTVIAAFRSMVWTSLIVLMAIYVFAVSITQGTVDHCRHEPESCLEHEGTELMTRFGSVDRSMLSLFATTTDGMPWDELMPAIHQLSPFYAVLFLTYVSLAYFAILNVVTGVFVETALHVAAMDRDAIIHEEMQSRESYAHSLHDIFLELDRDASDDLTIDEFRMALNDERVLAYFNALQIDFTDIMTLFVLLDRDENGAVNLDEFVRGCMRLKGHAKSLDLAKLQYEAEWIMHNVRHMMDTVSHLCAHLGTQPPRATEGKASMSVVASERIEPLSYEQFQRGGSAHSLRLSVRQNRMPTDFYRAGRSV